MADQVVAVTVTDEQQAALKVAFDLNGPYAQSPATPGKWVLTDLLLAIYGALPVEADA